MKIGVVSDTHDHIETYGTIANLFQQKKVEMIVHCGDWISPFSVALFVKTMHKVMPQVPVQGVFGNNDADIYSTIQIVESESLEVLIQKELLELEIDGKKIAVYHGTEEKIVEALLKSTIYNAVFRGHTHIPENSMEGSTLHLNPGTVCSYSNGQILKNASVAVYDSATNSAELLFFPRT